MTIARVAQGRVEQGRDATGIGSGAEEERVKEMAEGGGGEAAWVA